MDPVESGQLSAEDEYRHWWIRTRFYYLEKAFRLIRSGPPFDVVEVGCGTGQNLRYLRKESPHRNEIRHLFGTDPALPNETQELRHELKAFRSNNGQGRRFDLLLAMDVIEHVADDLAALREWSGYLNAGGVMFLTAPAFPALWSRHDEILKHHRRYTIRSLSQLSRKAYLEPVQIRYGFSHIFPAVYVIGRVLATSRGRQQTDLQRANPLLNTLLEHAGRLEAAVGGTPSLGPPSSAISDLGSPALNGVDPSASPGQAAVLALDVWQINKAGSNGTLQTVSAAAASIDGTTTRSLGCRERQGTTPNYEEPCVCYNFASVPVTSAFVSLAVGPASTPVGAFRGPSAAELTELPA